MMLALLFQELEGQPDVRRQGVECLNTCSSNKHLAAALKICLAAPSIQGKEGDNLHVDDSQDH